MRFKLHTTTISLAQQLKPALLCLLLSLCSVSFASTQQALEDTQQKIDVQQELLLQKHSEIDLEKTKLNKYSKKIIDKRVDIKQLELQVKRYALSNDQSSSNTTAKRTANYKLKVANIELEKLQKKHRNTQAQLEQLKTSSSTEESELLALSEQLASLEMKAEEERTKRKKAQQKKIAKKKAKKKRRVATAKPKPLNAQEQASLEHKQGLLRQQARAPSSSLANTMLLNTQAVALVPIKGKPNLGHTPKVKHKTDSSRFKHLGKMEHLGNSQYRLKTQLRTGNNIFRIEEYEYKKRISSQDAGKYAWLIIDARSVKQPEILLIKI